MSEKLLPILSEQLDEALNDPDPTMRVVREAGFWRGAVRGLVNNWGDNPEYVLSVLAGLVARAEGEK